MLYQENKKHFFVVGAQRCGSTYLWHALNAHFEICMATPVAPEPKYFLRRPENISYKNYMELHFENSKHAKLFGEKSTSYLENPHIAGLIKTVIGESKVIAILRNPVKRAISNYFFSRKNGFEDIDIEQAFESESARVADWTGGGLSACPYAYVSRGEYLRYLRAWRDEVGLENMKIVVMENILGNKKEVSSLYKFLGVSQNIEMGNFINNRVNSLEYSIESVPHRLLLQLRNHYRTWNEDLAAEFGLDIGAWGGVH